MSFEHDRRVIIYPAYLNSKRTVAEGRRIPKDKACEDPTAPEVVECCIRGLNIPAELESKAYCRDFFLRGRARVQLWKPDGSLTNPDVPNRKILYLKVADLVKRIAGRQNKRPGQAGKGPEPIQAGPSKPTAPTAGPSSSAAPAKPAKGKKKRK